MDTDFDKQLLHLISMAERPAWKDYSWKRALELDRCETGMWKGIAQELKEHMLAQRPASLPAPRKRGR